MDAVAYHPLLKVSKEDITKVREFYGLNDKKRIKESIEAILEWCQKQDHLVEASKYLNDGIVERLFILFARGSVEETKRRIDKLFTSRGMMSELCMQRNLSEFEKFLGCVNYVPLPNLCPSDQSRVMVTQFLTDKLDPLNIVTYFRYCYMLGEYRLHYDYALSERYIVDLNNFHLGHLSKINPVVVKKAEVLCTEGYGTKIKGIHILNAPPFVDRFVFLLKQALRDKVASRLHVHNSYEDLHKHISREILPKDYDGDEQSITKLSEQWKDILKTEESQRIIRELDHFKTDESKRQSCKFNEDYLGMPGSFRTLTVD